MCMPGIPHVTHVTHGDREPDDEQEQYQGDQQRGLHRD